MSGKIRPWRYYMVGVWRMLTPSMFKRIGLHLLLRGWHKRPDAKEIMRRVEFYCRQRDPFKLGDDAVTISGITLKNTHSRYYFDIHAVLDRFPKSSRIGFAQGDILDNPEYPKIVKNRRLASKTGLVMTQPAENSVILNLDWLRHYCRPVDNMPFEEKKGILVFRGECEGKPDRLRFLKMWKDSPLCDIGDTAQSASPAMAKKRMSIAEQLQYRYVLCIEGNDVATSLMWVMASGCIPVMPRPTAETWLMHSQMVPEVHYIEIKSDFTDVEEKLRYYNDHPEEAMRIAKASQEWLRQFDDPKRERIIAALVAKKYLSLAR